MSEGVSRSRQRQLHKRMDELFPQSANDECRVCCEPVVDGRWNYCSTRCREIANAVQRMFTWSSVREQILERDDYTCQQCGLTREMALTIYRHVDDLAHEAQRENETFSQVWERFGAPSHRPLEVDHITPLSEGGHPFDESNLQTLCEDCHTDKHAADEAAEPRPEITLENYL